jgi:hypothetical protein
MFDGIELGIMGKGIAQVDADALEDFSGTQVTLFQQVLNHTELLGGCQVLV